MPYTTIDLCAGIGGIRRGFELGAGAINLLSAENDIYASRTYEHLFGDNPFNDITNENFKNQVEDLEYDILMAGFPCQTFSRAGLQEGFDNTTKGIIFNHIAEIIRRTRPKAIFLENVDHLVTHQKGQTFATIINKLENDLNYKIMGVTRDINGEVKYNPKDFIRNSKKFGVPQNRPRTYIMGFDRSYFGTEVNQLCRELPKEGRHIYYEDIFEILEDNVPLRYYLSQGYFNTLINHRDRENQKGNGFGYRILNEEGQEHPIANTILATGGSGKERNLILDPRDGIAGQMVSNKQSGLNDRCVRMLTPTEWGRLQGFINFAFVNEAGEDRFSFPPNISIAQQYKQFGNSVTIPTIQCMAEFMVECLEQLGYER